MLIRQLTSLALLRTSLQVLACLAFFASEISAQQYHRVILPGHVNSERRELFPVWSPSGDTLFFQSNREIEGRPRAFRYWYSLYHDDQFDTPRVYDELKYTYDVGGMARDYLGNIYISASRSLGYMIYDVSRFDGVYRSWDRLSGIESNRWDGDPSITADGQHLFFVSSGNQQLEEKSSQIFVSHKQADGTWGRPINLGLNINGGLSDNMKGWNRMPVISPTGRTLYFTRNVSDVPKLYKSVKTGPADTDWSVPEPLAPPFNEDDWGTMCFAAHPSGTFVIICSWNMLTDTGYDMYRVNIGK